MHIPNLIQTWETEISVFFPSGTSFKKFGTSFTKFGTP